MKKIIIVFIAILLCQEVFAQAFFDVGAGTNFEKAYPEIQMLYAFDSFSMPSCNSANFLTKVGVSFREDFVFLSMVQLNQSFSDKFSLGVGAGVDFNANGLKFIPNASLSGYVKIAEGLLLDLTMKMGESMSFQFGLCF